MLGTTDSLDLFAGMGWSWSYDAGVRLARAVAGRGDLEGAASSGADAFRYNYGEGDELTRSVREASGEAVDFAHGPDGRVLARDGEPFAYEAVGRRTEDDRFVYRWNWRSELASVTVKDTWRDGEVSPFAGHQVRYEYDAQRRLIFRWHLGSLPAGETDDAVQGAVAVVDMPGWAIQGKCLGSGTTPSRRPPALTTAAQSP